MTLNEPNRPACPLTKNSQDSALMTDGGHVSLFADDALLFTDHSGTPPAPHPYEAYCFGTTPTLRKHHLIQPPFLKGELLTWIVLFVSACVKRASAMENMSINDF